MDQASHTQHEMTQFKSSFQSSFFSKHYKFGAQTKNIRGDRSIESQRTEQFHLNPDEKNWNLKSARFNRKESFDESNKSTNASQMLGSRDASPDQKQSRQKLKKDLTEVKDRESEEDSDSGSNTSSQLDSDSDESFRESYHNITQKFQWGAQTKFDLKSKNKKIANDEETHTRPKASLNLSMIPKRKVLFNPQTGKMQVEKPQIQGSGQHMSENQLTGSNVSTNESIVYETATYQHPAQIKFFRDFTTAVKAIEKSPFKLNINNEEKKQGRASSSIVFTRMTLN